MGNIGIHSGQISGNQESGLNTELMGAKKYQTIPNLLVRSSPKTGTQSQFKVLPDLHLGQRLRNTNNGDILHSGGTLSGRHHTRARNVQSRPDTPTQRCSFHKTELDLCPNPSRQNDSSRKTLDFQFKFCKSEPDLRFASTKGQNKGKKNRKKYKAPPPPTSTTVPQEKQPSNCDENLCEEYPSRRTRLFKTRFQSKKESSRAVSTFVNSVEKDNSDIIEEQIEVRENINILWPKSTFEFNFHDSNEFKKELREAKNRLKTAKVDVVESEEQPEPAKDLRQAELLPNNDLLIERRCPRGEPSGKESSTPEASPVLGVTDLQKPRAFYFGMEREDSDTSSSYPVEDDEENSTIALRLRPVLPRKPTQIPRFSPAVAWKLLDARSQDSGISGDARPSLPFSWTPQQDLEDDFSIDETIQEMPKSVTRQRQSSHVFSLSLPRDNHPTAFLATTSFNKSGSSSLRRLKRSFSGVLNTLSIKREQEKIASSREDDSNWFFTRSAPNSLNENSLELSDACIPHISSTARLMYLPETTFEIAPDKYPLSLFHKSCEELRVPESLRDTKTILDIPWSKEKQKKTKKFTFQSTVRQIERKRMADKLSKEAEKKEKQRLQELEAMRRVEEEFQRKRAKEKANIRQQLRIYAMNDNMWTSLPFDINLKTEERQEPDGALSSSNSSLSPSKTQEELRKHKIVENNMIAQVTKELSEYRQINRDYKEYRGSAKHIADNKGYFRQTTVHPQITCNMPNVKKGSNLESGNYRKDFASGIKSTKSIGSNQSEDFQHSYSPKMYRNKYAPITRF